ncbi:putative glycoside hydrolase family 76 protein [Rosellinia necatrix]|uniref:Mannan endo-1,6-alpha-mannosidase n=1 Tax=Rosellinia necatrix TaxID=77044 RepID=A0A1S7UJ43_ROSNE|nr:putative glycoside hydrolase family 76 protein [Rosellinia necatrix]
MIPRALYLLAAAGRASAQFYKIDTRDDIISSAKTLAYDLMSYYHGNESGQTPGILPGPPPAGDYYWWEGGALWGTMIDYWRLTDDTTYNDVITQAMLWQVGPNRNYMPPNVTASLGNDDQGFWGMSAMQAAEENFPDPPSDQPQWLALAQAVWNTQADPDRHDATCGGGLRWQIPFANNGYDYKNSIANGIFFNLGARLARYTNNQTYADWAEKTWDWVVSVGLMDKDYNIFDGAHVETNCTDVNRAQFSYNNGVFLLGAAYMYNFTRDSKWEERVNGLVNSTFRVFFPNDTAYEIACEQHMTCTTDMLSFKGYVHRWMSTATQIAPFTADKVLPVLRKSAQAAVNQCTGGTDGRTCGFSWTSGAFDGNVGAGQTMDVLAAVSSLLIGQSKAPVSSSDGGTSVGDPNAGIGSGTISDDLPPITTSDRAGASVVTAVIVLTAAAAFGWMSIGK